MTTKQVKISLEQHKALRIMAIESNVTLQALVGSIINSWLEETSTNVKKKTK